MGEAPFLSISSLAFEVSLITASTDAARGARSGTFRCLWISLVSSMRFCAANVGSGALTRSTPAFVSWGGIRETSRPLYRLLALYPRSVGMSGLPADAPLPASLFDVLWLREAGRTAVAGREKAAPVPF